ncbi:MAG TPA: purine-nucleoside phosphorylase [Gemmatimonadaceae bacterium]|nr:purine-nucleoside phosphorylase [Gemmatimonadaceae bacterium]
MNRYGTSAADAAADAIRERVPSAPRVAIILGSGLGGIVGDVRDACRIPYRDVPGFPSATVVGHAGELIGGMLAGVPVVALSGRFHMYEGHDAALAAFPVRVLEALGAKTLIVSNAAGSLRADIGPGSIVLLRDHINLMFRNPLTGAVEPGDERFPDMSEPYDPGLRAIARDVAREQRLTVSEGTYAGLLGPSYETRAEVEMLVRIGADLVGMSTVPEVIVARARGMRVLGFSCVTNLACGLAAAPITHQEVIETTARVSAQLQQLVRGIVSKFQA